VFATGSGQYAAADLGVAGVVGVVLPLYVPADVSSRGPRAEDLERSYARVYDELSRVVPYGLPGCTVHRRSVRTWLALEGAAPLANDPDAATRWVARGVRLFGLVHAEDNRLATSATGARHAQTGLTAEGRRLVKQIHEAGGIVDVSHASSRTLREVVELARTAGTAVVASHSNARALANHPRNLTDEEIRAIASTGGVVGINLHSPYLARGRRATLHDVVRHILHLVSVAGVQHAAVGTDFEGGISPPTSLSTARDLQKLPAALRRAGLLEADVRTIMAENALRLLCPAHKIRGSWRALPGATVSAAPWMSSPNSVSRPSPSGWRASATMLGLWQLQPPRPGSRRLLTDSSSVR
jgi:membrane dipeptidase